MAYPKYGDRSFGNIWRLLQQRRPGITILSPPGITNTAGMPVYYLYAPGFPQIGLPNTSSSRVLAEEELEMLEGAFRVTFDMLGLAKAEPDVPPTPPAQRA